ncbi:MAG: DUF1624 domain-containing protein [Burkholderiales bacterium]|nr:DUF1624 domain-containing protein [Burkholderiales bacterium]
MTVTPRLRSIDALRGLVIMLMALDHTRDYFSPALFDPLDWQSGSAAWFWTRWVTHLCAPSFVLLAGMSAYLRSRRYSRPDMTRYLLSRGFLLVVLEWTWVSFSWQFAYHSVILQVIWAIGVAMMALGLLIWLPRSLLIVTALALILPHNLLDAMHAKDAGIAMIFWHQGGSIPLANGVSIDVYYPLMPWIGLMATGYAVGPVMLWPAAQRQRFLLASAVLLMLAFVLLRSGNFYGDPDHWQAQGQGWMIDLMAFVKVHKYPPSLLYLCVTLSISCFLLMLFERYLPEPPKILLLFGSSPMFFYMVHIALIHALSWVYMQTRFGRQIDFQSGNDAYLGYTPSLAITYVACLLVLLLMWQLTLRWQLFRKARS